MTSHTLGKPAGSWWMPVHMQQLETGRFHGHHLESMMSYQKSDSISHTSSWSEITILARWCISVLFFLCHHWTFRTLCRQQIWRAVSTLICRQYGNQLSQPYSRMDMQTAMYTATLLAAERLQLKNLDDQVYALIRHSCSKVNALHTTLLLLITYKFYSNNYTLSHKNTHTQPFFITHQMFDQFQHSFTGKCSRKFSIK